MNLTYYWHLGLCRMATSDLIEDITPPHSWLGEVDRTESEVLLLKMANLNRRNASVTTLRRITALILDDSYDADRHELEQEMQCIQMHFERFMQAHDGLVAIAQPDELIEHTELWDHIETIFNRAAAKLRRLLTSIEVEDGSIQRGSLRSVQLNNGVAELRLDPVSVPTFDGKLHSWLAFKDAFETMVHDPATPEAYKLAKLRAAVKGDAVQLVGGMYTGGYQAVWQALKNRYDNPKQLAEIHVSRFINMKAQSTETTTTLLAIVDTVREALRALAVMKLPVESWDALAVPIVTSKLPDVTQQAWGMSLTSNAIPTLESLLSFIEKRAHSITSDVLKWPSSGNLPSATINRRTMATPVYSQRLAKSYLAASSSNNCGLCNDGSHYIGKCPKLLALPVAERFLQLKRSNLCFNCLKPGHATKVCQSGNCRNCNGHHHTILCRGSKPISRIESVHSNTASHLASAVTNGMSPQNHND